MSKRRGDLVMSRKLQGQQTRQRILEFIILYLEEHGYPPSRREIARGIGIKSVSTIQNHIMKMLEMGMLETDAAAGEMRAIRVPGMKVRREDGQDNEM